MDGKELLYLAFAGLCFFAVSILLGDYVSLMVSMGLDGKDLLSMNIIVVFGVGFYGYMGIRSFKAFIKVHDERLYKEWKECTL